MKQQLDKVVQWYPGHMVRAMRRIGEYLKLIDIVIEVIDARAPRSDANPFLDEMVANKERFVVLSRNDLADPHVTPRWVEAFAARGREAIAAEARQQQSVSRILAAVTARAKKNAGLTRAIVVGVPNSGKSSVINGLLKRAAAKTEDRAGVTRQLQWFKLTPTIELMDSPGILVPKIATKDSQWKLALIGAVPRERYDPAEVAYEFHRWLSEHQPGRSGVPDLEAFARARGFMKRGGAFDEHNAAQSYVKSFGEGSFGRISLEAPGDDDESAA
jgi:ribosome biogenesis GTPase A